MSHAAKSVAALYTTTAASKQQGFKVLWADMIFIFSTGPSAGQYIYEVKVAMIESSLKETSRDHTDTFIAWP